MKVYLLEPYGFCEGVKFAIAKATTYKNQNKDKNVYTLNPLVHNEIVNSELDRIGIKSFDNKLSDLDKIKKLNNGDCLLLPAHGHDIKIEKLLNGLGIKYLDCACPLVKLEEEKVKKLINSNKKLLYIGKKDHAETKSILSISDNIIFYEKNIDLNDYFNDEINVAVQTTFNVTEFNEIILYLKTKFNKVNIISNICQETNKRQNNVKLLPKNVDYVFIVGSKTSSNTLRLYEIARSYFDTLNIKIILDADDIKLNNLNERSINAAMISSASTSKENIIRIKEKLEKF